MSNFGESVDDDKDGIMTLLRSRKTGDEVHLNLVPFPSRNRQWLQSSCRSLMFCLDATTNITFINITSNVLLHVRPPVPFPQSIWCNIRVLQKVWGQKKYI